MSSSSSRTDGPPARRRPAERLPLMTPAPEPGAEPTAPRRARRVFVTGGVAASAAVLAMSVQSGQASPAGDDIAPCATCGDAAADGPGLAEGPGDLL